MPTATLYGLQANLDTLRSLSGTVDVAEWMASQSMEQIIPGLHALPVEVKIPDGFEMSDDISVYIEFATIQDLTVQE